MSRKIAVQEEISPNLIPMVDIMFLLLLFFMLSADMGQRELEEVVLPKAMSVKEDKESKGGKDRDRLTINVYHRAELKCGNYNKGAVCREENHWRVGLKGKDYTDPEKMLNMLKREAGTTGGDITTPKISERKVMIRADASAPYGLAQRSMNVCAKAGIYKVEVGAAQNMDAKKKKV